MSRAERACHVFVEDQKFNDTAGRIKNVRPLLSGPRRKRKTPSTTQEAQKEDAIRIQDLLLDKAIACSNLVTVLKKQRPERQTALGTMIELLETW
jgi:hypothetical protein